MLFKEFESVHCPLYELWLLLYALYNLYLECLPQVPLRKCACMRYLHALMDFLDSIPFMELIHGVVMDQTKYTQIT